MPTSEGAGGGSIPDPRPWPRHGSRAGTEYRIFTTSFEEFENPRTGRRMERVVVDAPKSFPKNFKPLWAKKNSPVAK